MEVLEDVCLHLGKGCNKQDICDGRGEYIENNKTVSCGRCVYRQVELWRTDFMPMKIDGARGSDSLVL